VAQLTRRVPDEMVPDPKEAAAAALGKSLNAWVMPVLTGAVDPNLTGATRSGFVNDWLGPGC